MRKNTESALNAFVTGKPFYGPRDTVTVSKDGDIVWSLHGNPIAHMTPWKSLGLSTCGWNTPTTWNRLIAVANAYGVQFVREASMKHEPTYLQVARFENVHLIGLVSHE